MEETPAPHEEVWNKTYGGTDDDWAWAVKHATDDGYILAGFTKSYGAGDEDFWLVKTDSNGNEQWDRTFGGSDSDRAMAVK